MTEWERERFDRIEKKVDTIIEHIVEIKSAVNANTRFRRTFRTFLLALIPVATLSLISIVAWAVSIIKG